MQLPVALYWDARRSWTFREFAVLCGVYSLIGRDPARVVYRTDIAACAAGYNNVREYRQWNPDDQSILSTGKLRWTLDRLEKRHLFFRGTATRRKTVFGRREEPVIEVAANIAAKASVPPTLRRRRDLKITSVADQKAAKLLSSFPSDGPVIRDKSRDHKRDRKVATK